jgi:TPR repeat protein
VALPKASSVGRFFYANESECDYEQAFLWFLKGALSNDPPSMCGLGEMYLYGDFVKNCDESALYWLTRAAEARELRAAEVLFDAYFDKSYRLFDLKKAQKWADFGYELSLTKSQIFKVMQGLIALEKKDYRRAIYAFRRAEKKGNGALGAYYLGFMHQMRLGFNDSNSDLYAIHYYQKAARKGYDEAIIRLREYLVQVK